MFWPGLTMEGLRSPGGTVLDEVHQRVQHLHEPDNKDPGFTMPVAVYARDPLLRVRMDYGGPTMSLNRLVKELALKGDAEEEERRSCQFLNSVPKGRDWSRRSLFLLSSWLT